MLLLNFMLCLRFCNDISFNTSYVVIKRETKFSIPLSDICFNTSYVVIKPADSSKGFVKSFTFQYILCCY